MVRNIVVAPRRNVASPRRLWLLAAADGQGEALIECLAGRSGRQRSGFFVLEENGLNPFRTGDVLAMRTQGGLESFQYAEESLEDDQITRSVAWVDSALTAAAANGTLSTTTEELIFVRLWGNARALRKRIEGAGILSHTFGMMQTSDQNDSPYLLRSAAEDLLSRLDGKGAAALRAMLYRMRARALIDIASQHPRVEGELNDLVAASYQKAEDGFAMARFDALATTCRRDRNRASEALKRLAAPQFPGFKRERDNEKMPRRLGFRAYRCLAIQVHGPENEPALEAGPGRSALARHLSFLNISELRIEAALAGTKSDTVAPIVTVYRDEKELSTGLIEVTLEEEHKILFGLHSSVNGSDKAKLLVSVRVRGATIDPAVQTVFIGECSPFTMILDEPIPVHLEIYLTVNGKTEKIQKTVEKHPIWISHHSTA